MALADKWLYNDITLMSKVLLSLTRSNSFSVIVFKDKDEEWILIGAEDDKLHVVHSVVKEYLSKK